VDALRLRDLDRRRRHGADLRDQLAEQVQWNLGDSGAVAVIVESASHEEEYRAIESQLPDVKNVWQIDAGGLEELARPAATSRRPSWRPVGRR
jgi:long-chain acyl-CoA synthetase